MFYAWINEAGGTSISPEKPQNIPCVEIATIPDGEGVLTLQGMELVRIPPVKPEQDETPEQSGNEYNAFLEGLMEGYKNG